MQAQVTRFTTRSDVRYVLRDMARMLVLVALTASLPAAAAAQSSLDDLAAGTRVRVSAASFGSSPRIGRVVRASRDSLVVQTTDGRRLSAQAIPSSQITRLDVSWGAGRGHKSQFAGIGFLVGAGIAQLIPHEDSQESPYIGDGDVSGFVDGLLLGGLGAAIGAYLGRAREDWRRVPLGATQLSLRVPQSGKGLGIGATVAF